jgi:biopolymer transport protein ExbB
MLPFLQADPIAASEIAKGVQPTEIKQSFFDLLVAGGWTMVPIGLLFFLAIYLVIERYLTIKRSDKDPQQFMSTVRSYILTGDLQKAKEYCIAENTPFARMILKGITRLGSPLNDIASAIEAVGNLEIHQLEKRLGILATIAGAAPMLGFLGTVLGMIEAFLKIAAETGSITPDKLAGPISTALVTTAAGLVVGIIAYFGYNYLVNLVGQVIYKMEATSTEFADLLQEPA